VALIYFISVHCRGSERIEPAFARMAPNMDAASAARLRYDGDAAARLRAAARLTAAASALVFVDVMKELCDLVQWPFNFDTLATRTRPCW
jgi:hypothetical protein